jgi:predicted RNase H-like HicB family nuclease
MKTTNKLRVIFERDEDNWWVARIPSLPGALTQGKSIDQARTRIREALSLFINNADTVELVDDIRIDDEARERIEAAKQLRHQADKLQSQAAAAARTVVADLRMRKLSLRDVANVLEVSASRIQQLVVDEPYEREYVGKKYLASRSRKNEVRRTKPATRTKLRGTRR